MAELAGGTQAQDLASRYVLMGGFRTDRRRSGQHI